MTPCFFDYMNEVNVEVPSIEALSAKAVSTYYQHRDKPEIRFTNLDEAFELSLNLAEYEKKSAAGYLRTQIAEAIFKDFTNTEKSNAVSITREFLKIIEEIHKPAGMNFEVIGLGEMTKEQRKHELFLKDKRAAFAKIQSLKGAFNAEVQQEQARVNLLNVYAEYGEIYKPREKKVKEPVAAENVAIVSSITKNQE